MNYNNNDDIELDKDTFDSVINALKNKNKKADDFITKAGEGFKNLVFTISKQIWKTEDIPDIWDHTTLIQIFKKGPKNLLKSFKYIHNKD